MIFVLQVMTGKEDYIKNKMNEFGYKGIVPKHLVCERKQSKNKTVEKLFFPSYVFVECQAMNEILYYYLVKQDHVVGFLGGGHPQWLPPDEEEYILKLHNSGEPIEESIISKDDKIISGILTDEQVEVIKIDKHKKRAIIGMNVCGQQKEISLGIKII